VKQPAKNSNTAMCTAPADITTSHALRATFNGVVPTPNFKDGVGTTP